MKIYDIYWKPKYKWQLVEWLKKRCDRNWNKFSKNQLYAIYCDTREKMLNE